MRDFLLFLFLCWAHYQQVECQPACDDCWRAVCANASEPQCTLLNSTPCTSNCGNRDAIVTCSNGMQTFLNLTSSTRRNCAGDERRLSLSRGSSQVLSNPGSYIIARFEFCESGYIDRILFRSSNTNSLDLSNLDDAIQFYTYKRYSEGGSVYYLQQLAFNVTLRYNMTTGYIEAIPRNPSNPLLVYEGENFGFSIIDRSIRISLFTNSPVDGIHNITQLTNAIQCSEIAAVELANTSPLINMLPSIVVRLTNETTVKVTSTNVPTTGIDATTSGIGSTNTNTNAPTNSNAPTLEETASMSVITEPQATTFIIVGAAIGGCVLIAILITIIILTIVCFKLYPSKRLYGLPSSYSSNRTFSDECISMNTYNSNYMENENFSPPFKLSRDVETVENYAAEPDYNEPYEMMNAAQARALPNPPGPVVTNNVHYATHGSNGTGRGTVDSASLQYQDPEALAITPILRNKRTATWKNALYTSTGRLQEEITASLTNQDTAVYDEPHELQEKNNGVAPHEYHELEDPSRAKNTMSAFISHGNSTEIINDIYNTDSEDDDETDLPLSIGRKNSEPFAAGHKSQSESTSVTLSPVSPVPLHHVYHELEPNREIAKSTGHPYHLLETESEVEVDKDFLKSGVHHVVDEAGAYVPNSEERKELFGGDTLSAETYETWKKSSFKERKFFVKNDIYWTPSSIEKNLYNQLNQKKFREISKEQLSFESHLGEGQFGTVQKAKLSFSGGTMDAAVKIMKVTILPDAKVRFLQEAAILGQFFHSNVIRLYGVVTVTEPAMILMEYMQLGDLHNYMWKQYRPQGAAPPSPKTLLSFARQIVCGMKYLAKKKFVHRDLAARNIFVNASCVCKIGDFGMSRNLLDETYYISHGGVVPIKWTAPEALNYKKYSTSSDVYSYGMTLFEIWSLGEKPLRDIPIEKVAKVTAEGHCQAPPPGTSRKIYEIMVQCWNPKYGDRPSFSELFEILNGCDDELLNWSEEDKARIIDSPNAMVIGSTLEEGKCLFKDLQHRYHGVTPDDVA